MICGCGGYGWWICDEDWTDVYSFYFFFENLSKIPHFFQTSLKWSNFSNYLSKQTFGAKWPKLWPPGAFPLVWTKTKKIKSSQMLILKIWRSLGHSVQALWTCQDSLPMNQTSWYQWWFYSSCLVHIKMKLSVTLMLTLAGNQEQARDKQRTNGGAVEDFDREFNQGEICPNDEEAEEMTRIWHTGPNGRGTDRGWP